MADSTHKLGGHVMKKARMFVLVFGLIVGLCGSVANAADEGDGVKPESAPQVIITSFYMTTGLNGAKDRISVGLKVNTSSFSSPPVPLPNGAIDADPRKARQTALINIAVLHEAVAEHLREKATSPDCCS